jgi:hypothetical protein
MQAYEDVLIRVHAEWNGWLNAEVRMGDLRDVHWLQSDHAPHAIAHAYLACSSLVTGRLGHCCEPDSAPHRLLVCILKKHVVPAVYAELARRADEHAAPRPSLASASQRPAPSSSIRYRTGA